MLTGTEVKSLRNGKASIKEAYARLRNGEVFLDGMNITPYEQGNRYNHDPVRTRKLLLHRREIEKLIGAVEQKGLTLVPLELYFRRGRAKVVVALGRGKKQHDKREDLKRRVDRARDRARRLAAGTPMSLIAALAAILGVALAAPPWSDGVAAARDHGRRAPGRDPDSRAPRRIRLAGGAGEPAGRGARWADPGGGRVGGGDRRSPAVPVPDRRAALPVQQPAPAARGSGVAGPRHAVPARTSSSPRSSPTIWATAIGGTPRGARLGELRGRHDDAWPAARPPKRGRLAQRSAPRPHRHHRPRPWRRRSRESRHLLSAGHAREGRHPPGRACCSGTSSSGGVSVSG